MEKLITVLTTVFLAGCSLFGKGFQRLVGYSFGGNKKQQKIAIAVSSS
jgi:hypothetical protein